MVSDNALNVSVWDAVRTALTASTIFVTNSTTNVTTRASIEAKYNDKAYTPQVIISPAEYNENNYKFGSNIGKKDINVTIECYYKDTLGIEQMADQVDTLIKNSISTLGMDLVGVTTSYAYAGVNDTKVNLLSLTYTFNRE